MSVFRSVAARLPVGAIREHVGLIAMIAGELVNVRMAPGIVGEILLQIRPVPLLDAARLHAQRRQTLFGARIAAGIEMILAQRKLEVFDLLLGRDHAGLVALIQQAGPTTAAKTAMITTTTSISISVTPARGFC